MPTTLADCRALDARDPLAGLRQEFNLPAGVVYLNGNSLGAQPKLAAARAQQVVTQEWGQGLVRSWNGAGWFDLPLRLGKQLGRLIGARENEVLLTDSTSVNLFKLLSVALRLQHERDSRRRVIVSERRNFPTDLYIVQGLIDQLQAHGASAYTLRLVDGPEELEEAMDEEVAVLLLTHVHYQSGYMHDLAATTALAHRHGALVLWDLCHSAGAVPVDLHGADADFAVGCTYKYLNGGPGAPAYLWVHTRHHAHCWQPLSGWWGHARPFAMEPGYQPRQGIGRYLCGTQPITALALVECGLDAFAKTTMSALRHKSLALGALFMELVQQECAPHGLHCITPTEAARRASHISYEHPHGFAVVQALIARGVIPDYREPRIMRFGLAPLYNSYCDVWQAVAALRAVLDSGEWQQARFQQRPAVT
ncbi:MAG: kynureninase [Rhodoferax sp.]